MGIRMPSVETAVELVTVTIGRNDYKKKSYVQTSDLDRWKQHFDKWEQPKGWRIVSIGKPWRRRCITEPGKILK